MQTLISENKSSLSKMKFNIRSGNSLYDFTLIYKNDEFTFKFEDLKEFPVKIFELIIDFEKLKQLNEDFYMFKSAEKFIKTIKKSIEANNYSIAYDEEENTIIFEMKNDIFENGGVKLKIPEQAKDLKSYVEALTKTITEMKKEIQEIKVKELEKNRAALESFFKNSFLLDDEKILISKWIHPNKVIKFNLLFNSAKDGDTSSYFHYYCDGVFPTIIVVSDVSGRKFGGYSTQNWCKSSIGSFTSRATGSFIFNLTNKQKFELIDNCCPNAVYRYEEYGPCFGSGNDIYIADGCKSNNESYCSNIKCSYNTGDNNLLGENGKTNFKVANYEVYQVIFE